MLFKDFFCIMKNRIVKFVFIYIMIKDMNMVQSNDIELPHYIVMISTWMGIFILFNDL